MHTLLCVDDDPEIQILYKSILEQRNYITRMAVNGADAIRSFIREPADVILLDIEMPGMKGIDTCREIRKLPNGNKVPIIVVSAKHDEDTITQALTSGANEYIVKPFKNSELLAKINFAIKRRRAGISETGDIPSTYTDRYEIISKIDEGGHTTVYRALDINNNPPKEVALKIFKVMDSSINIEQTNTLFLREAYEWSKLVHNNIVKLFDFGHVADSYYLVLEYIDGINLWDQVAEHGPLDEQHLILITHEIAQSLRHISSYNLVHRDVKPNNILLSFSGDVKLTDFGLVKNKGDIRDTINQLFKGTPDFVSPEQIDSQGKVDIKSDLYSLGATMYYAATATLPFRGKSIIETLNNHFSLTPKPIHDINTGVGKTYSAIIGKLLTLKKEDRITVDKLIAHLSSIL
jgi:serine/threonine protein kinase/CheY-like chemotaxis protein